MNLQWVLLILLVVLLMATVAKSAPEPQPCVLVEPEPFNAAAILDEIDREFAEAQP